MPLNKSDRTQQCDECCAWPASFVEKNTDGGASVDTGSLRTCNDLGICQGRSPACVDCKPKKPVHYFAPGTISGGEKSDFWLEPVANRFKLHWIDWVGGTAILIVLAMICGYVS